MHFWGAVGKKHLFLELFQQRWTALLWCCFLASFRVANRDRSHAKQNSFRATRTFLCWHDSVFTALTGTWGISLGGIQPHWKAPLQTLSNMAHTSVFMPGSSDLTCIYT
eukprot:1141743-Pelagomonas_calceolata.AAC.3